MTLLPIFEQIEVPGVSSNDDSVSLANSLKLYKDSFVFNFGLGTHPVQGICSPCLRLLLHVDSLTGKGVIVGLINKVHHFRSMPDFQPMYPMPSVHDGRTTLIAHNVRWWIV